MDERESIGTYGQLIEEVRARCGADVASLFAEPIKGINRATGVQNIAWYCDVEGTPFLLRQLDPTARQPIVDLLKQRLRSFSSLLGDHRSGAILGSWLYILSPDSIMAVSGQPVIKNWGMVPTDLAASDEARDTHFRNTIGLYLPGVPTPPFTEIEAQSFAARMAQLAERESAKAARPPPAEPLRRSPASFNTALAAPPPLPVRTRRGMTWIAPAAACAVAGVFLLLFLYGHILRYPAPDPVPDDSLIEAQRQTNQALRDRLDQLKRAAADVCVAPGSHRASDLLPPSPTYTKVTATVPGKPSDVVALGALLERATVLVVVDNAIGSGFFISDHQIITNHHVVEDKTKALVGNKALGQFFPARVVAVGVGQGEGRQDFAVLEISPNPNAAVLRIAITPTKLTQVTASGFPGVLLDTNSAVMPEPNLTQGQVNSFRLPNGIKTIVHSAQIGHGNSGGPLVDPGGCVVGVNSWSRYDMEREATNATFYEAIDVSELRSFLQSKGIGFTGSDAPCMPVSEPPSASPPVPAAPPSPAP